MNLFETCINTCIVSCGHLLIVRDTLNSTTTTTTTTTIDLNNVELSLTRSAQSPCETIVITEATSRDELYLFLIQAPSNTYDEFVMENTMENNSKYHQLRTDSSISTDQYSTKSSSATTVVMQPSQQHQQQQQSQLNTSLMLLRSNQQTTVPSATRGGNSSSTVTTSRDIVLIHDLHKASTRTQAALLEVLCHKQVVFNDRIYCMKDNFVCVATITSGSENNVLPSLLQKFLMSVELHDQQKVPIPSKPIPKLTFHMQRKLNEMHNSMSVKQYIRDIIVTCRHDPNLSTIPLPEATNTLELAAKYVINPSLTIY
jgi:hypothetical protein